jgi:hypothetical protein
MANDEPQPTLTHPSCLKALAGVRNLLVGVYGQTAADKPIIRAYAQRLDELCNALRDKARTLLVRRYLDGELTDDQARECVAILEAEDSGRWDPDEIEAVADQLDHNRAVVRAIGRVACSPWLCFPPNQKVGR